MPGDVGPRLGVRALIGSPRWRPALFVAVAALGVGASLAALVLTPARYRASVEVSYRVADAVKAALPPDLAAARLERRLPAIREALRDTSLVAQSAAAAGLAATPEVRARLAEGIDAQGVSTEEFRLDYVDTDPARAALVANRLAEGFVAQAERARPGPPPFDAAVLAEKLAATRQAIERNTAALRGASEPAPQATPTPAPADAGLERRLAQRKAAAAELAHAEAQLELVRKNAPAAPAPDPELTRLRSQLAELRLRYTDEHPDVQAVRRRIGEIEAAAPRPQTAAHEDALRLARDEVRRLKDKLTAASAAVARSAPRPSAPRPQRSPAPGLEAARLAEERQQLQDAYATLLRQEAANQAAAVAARLRPDEVFRVVRPAQVPTAATFPNPYAFVLAGLVAGIVLGLAATAVAEARDHTVKSAGELEALLGRPLLAAVPFVTRREARGHVEH
jgi:uncharacterized protein involved in exopolysaccharide biosynthesis